MKISLIIFSLLFTTLTANALGRVVGYEELATNHFASIQKISQCGDYRLIESYLYGGSMIFIDEVKHTEERIKVVKGFSFAEINNDHNELNIEKVSCNTQKKQFVFVTGTVNGTGHDDKIKYDFTIRLDAINGTYQYKDTFKNES